MWLPLPEEVVTYASSDGTVVSADTGPANAGDSDDDDDSVDWESAEEDTPSLQVRLLGSSDCDSHRSLQVRTLKRGPPVLVLPLGGYCSIVFQSTRVDPVTCSIDFTAVNVS